MLLQPVIFSLQILEDFIAGNLLLSGFLELGL